MHPDFVVATEMLAVPQRHTRTTTQADGTACVWCGDPPDVSLGPRLGVADGDLYRWLPHACHTCVSQQAARVHQAHRGSCYRCTPWEHCPDSRALYTLSLPHLQPR